MITMISGKAGSGKTEKALELLREFSKEKKVLYITNQVFSVTGEGAKFLNNTGLKLSLKITGVLDNLTAMTRSTQAEIIIIDNLTCLCKDLETSMSELEKISTSGVDIYYTVQTDGDGDCEGKELLKYNNLVIVSTKRK